MDKHRILKEYFGYDSFRAGQEQLVDAILAGRDVFGVMPTGAGKSLCYQVPALLLPGVTLVVSPLISLMQDQVRALIEVGAPAAYLNSALTPGQYRHALRNARQGQYKIIYVAPERLLTPLFSEFAKSVQISLVAVDEAHCVSQWGQDFRPGYLQIAPFLRGLTSRPPVAAFTATATAEVRRDVVRLLELRDPVQVVTGFDRRNLYYEVRAPKDKKRALLEILAGFPQEAGIVYCATRKNVEDVCDFLNQQGVRAARYHAGLPKEERTKNQEDFLYDRVRVMVATNAFGMGIDKSDVRFVVHFNMPKDMESYYQEAGRAGRDGAPARCILLYSGTDVHTNQFLITHSHTDGENLDEKTRAALVQRDLDRLRQMTFYSTTTRCLRHFILDYFGEESPLTCDRCSNCTQPGKDVDITVDAQKILSCVKRTGERFGAALISEILRGAKTARIRDRDLDQQSTYGLLQNLSDAEVRARIDRLLDLGCLLRSGGEYPVLSLGPVARGVLFEGRKVRMRVRRKPLPTRVPRGEALQHPALYERLRALRAEIAKKQSVPAFVVFTDATLREMCAQLPQDEPALLRVSGMGEKKMRRYGARFLEAICDYVAQKGAS